MIKSIALVNILAFSLFASAGEVPVEIDAATKSAYNLTEETKNPEFAALNTAETAFWFSDGAPGSAWYKKVEAGEVQYGADLERLLVDSGFMEQTKALIGIYETSAACVAEGKCQAQVFCDGKYSLFWDVFHAYQAIEPGHISMVGMRKFLRESCPLAKAQHCDAVNGDAEVFETAICGPEAQ